MYQLKTFCWCRWEVCIGVQLFDAREERQAFQEADQATQQTRQPHLYLADWSKTTSCKLCALQHQENKAGENSRENGVQRALNKWRRHDQILPSIPGAPYLAHEIGVQTITSFISENPHEASEFFLGHEIDMNPLSFLILFQILAQTCKPGKLLSVSISVTDITRW